ncbi:hypothetical protein F5Y04DRAFT_167273 [Hypomontagnella monticulosa]|nr:hypothetical protein F5Y04DRAFT_167273 [Hypomontagnella monticulosa]
MSDPGHMTTNRWRLDQPNLTETVAVVYKCSVMVNNSISGILATYVAHTNTSIALDMEGHRSEGQTSTGDHGQHTIHPTGRYMPDGVYDDNENLEVAMIQGGYDRPFWWPPKPRRDFSRVEYDGSARADKMQDIAEYKQYWSSYTQRQTTGNYPSKICGRKIYDTLTAMAPYCGFGGGPGIDDAVYFLDTIVMCGRDHIH